MGDRQRHEWFEVYVGCCTSGSIRIKGAAASDLGVMRTDQWFTTVARNCTAGRRMPTSTHNGLLIRGERRLNSELVHDQGGPDGMLRIAAEALQSTGTAEAPALAYQDRGVLELVSCNKCGCGTFRCVVAEIMTRRDETRNEAGGVG